MYVIVIYDADVKRVNKYHKLLKQYLYPVQNSSFEGELKQSSYTEMVKRLKGVNSNNLDSIIIYQSLNSKYLIRKTIGITKEKDFTIV